MIFTLRYFFILTLVFYTNSLFAEKTVELNDRINIFNALQKQKIFNKHRILVHLTHICDLIIDNRHYPVINIKEHVKGAQVPRGVGHIIVLDSSLNLIKKIYHDGASSPLYCKDNKLFLYGYIDIDGLAAEGNVLSFGNKGKKVVVSEMESNDFPKLRIPQ
ncbi:hypothetical protein MNBD_GAMMA10-2483 [hydrothermal vent metagenome]|uniref:Uncharacterized protein n=1 Tax=hydrothermal vent metagenome TaxID=652676 RepID=A0A3B0YJE2_9ZZZZ